MLIGQSIKPASHHTPYQETLLGRLQRMACHYKLARDFPGKYSEWTDDHLLRWVAAVYQDCYREQIADAAAAILRVHQIEVRTW